LHKKEVQQGVLALALSPSANGKGAPEWLQRILDKGYEIYIGSSERLLPLLNTRPFGCAARCYTLENPDHHMFHEAYLLSNSLSFRKPDMKMPHWVLIDCVLMQSAVIGFMKPVETVPEDFLHFFRSDRYIDFSKVTHIPVTGQIASPALDGQSLVGMSLFSLARRVSGDADFGFYTKALALEVHGHERYPLYYGAAQYDNPSLRIHGRFAQEMEIYQPIVPLHTLKDMTFIYKMAIEFDSYKLETEVPRPDAEPSFWMKADDLEAKRRMQAGQKIGKRYIIAPPYSETREDGIYLPIVEKEAKK
jgi:hypothetical protein